MKSLCNCKRIEGVDIEHQYEFVATLRNRNNQSQHVVCRSFIFANMLRISIANRR